MKRIIIAIALISSCVALLAQSSLQTINQQTFNSAFLKSISKHPFGYGAQDDKPIYSWLTGAVPEMKWVFYGDDNYVKRYKVSVAKGWPQESADGVQFAVCAYTKGDYIVAICDIMSFCDINEHRLYTYDYSGRVIDSLILQHDFVAEGGHCIMPLAGALKGNLDVMICEIK